MKRPPDEKTEVVGGVEYRYFTSWIYRLPSEVHWRLYWGQQKLMDGLVQKGDRVLEIGVGNGFTANYLRSQGVDVTTIDIDAEKQPDIVANIVSYEFPERFDAILAFEVFEHMPYQDFVAVLSKMKTTARRHVFLSVPRNRKLAARFELKLPKLRARTFELNVRKGKIDEVEHVWEVDHGEISVASLEATLEAPGFSIERRDEKFNRLLYALANPEASPG